MLKAELEELGFTLATKQRYLPIVLSKREISAILCNLNERNRLIISLLYGSGLRITECLRLRVQDIHFDRMAITVRDGKGRKERQTLMSQSVVEPLRNANFIGTTTCNFLRSNSSGGAGKG